MASQSTKGRDFSDFEMLDAKMASALKRIISNQSFRRRANVEEERAQKHYRFPPGRQMAYMIYDRFRAISARDAALDLSDLKQYIPYKEMTLRISIQDGTKLYQLQVKHLKKMSWRVCTS